MRTLVRILSRLPLSVLYGIARVVVFPLAYHIVRYRRKLVRKNMTNAFPERSPREIRQLERKFYLHFSDLIAEIIYGAGASNEQMHQRMRFENTEQLIALTKQYGTCIMMGGHMGNWEWQAQIGNELKATGVHCIHAYRTQKSKAMNNLMLAIRERRGSLSVDKNAIVHTMLRNMKDGKQVVYGMIADQKPSPVAPHYYWTTFLRQDTPFMDGCETIARKFNIPVVYGEMKQIKRGYYQITFRLISEHSRDTEPGFITEQFARLIQQDIIEQPEQWLWTHNRWKYHRTQPQYAESTNQ